MPETTEHVEIWGRRFTRPRLTIYQAAERRFRLSWNRYGAVAGHGGAVIGASLTMWSGRCWSLTWAKPTVRKERVR